jgi:DNA polymerase-1
LGEIQCQSIRDAGKFFKLNCPMDGEYRIGNNWQETH